MKLLLLALCTSLGLAGCATGSAPVGDDIDRDKVAAVERAAQRNGVRVYWMHMPRKVTGPAGT